MKLENAALALLLTLVTVFQTQDHNARSCEVRPADQFNGGKLLSRCGWGNFYLIEVGVIMILAYWDMLGLCKHIRRLLSLCVIGFSGYKAFLLMQQNRSGEEVKYYYFTIVAEIILGFSCLFETEEGQCGGCCQKCAVKKAEKKEVKPVEKKEEVANPKKEKPVEKKVYNKNAAKQQAKQVEVKKATVQELDKLTDNAQDKTEAYRRPSKQTKHEAMDKAPSKQIVSQELVEEQPQEIKPKKVMPYGNQPAFALGDIQNARSNLKKTNGKNKK